MSNKTKIEWCDYTINPVKGLCPMACKDNQGKEYCYARRMYKQFKWNPAIRYIGKMSLIDELLRIPRNKLARIFMGSTIELFGDWVKPEWLTDIFALVRKFPFTFIFLTKQPQNLIKWSPFPDNCWVGVSVTNPTQLVHAINGMALVEAKVKIFSFEPLLEQLIGHNEIINANLLADINWVIIGQVTPVKQSTQPKIEWIREIVEAADRAGIPLFLKNNLKPLLKNEQGWTPAIFVNARNCSGNEYLRQEMPE